MPSVGGPQWHRERGVNKFIGLLVARLVCTTVRCVEPCSPPASHACWHVLSNAVLLSSLLHACAAQCICSAAAAPAQQPAKKAAAPKVKKTTTTKKAAPKKVRVCFNCRQAREGGVGQH